MVVPRQRPPLASHSKRVLVVYTLLLVGALALSQGKGPRWKRKADALHLTLRTRSCSPRCFPSASHEDQAQVFCRWGALVETRRARISLLKQQNPMKPASFPLGSQFPRCRATAEVGKNGPGELTGKVWKLDGRLVVINGTLEMKLKQGHVLEMEGGARAVLLWERQAVYFAYLLPGSQTPESAEETYLTEKKRALGAGPRKLEGEVLDMFGQRLDNKLSAEDEWPIFNAVPQQQDLQTIRRSLLTGVTAVDSLAPMGMGQNMLVIGEKGTGKTSLVTSAMLAQGATGVKVIYANLKGEHQTEVEKILTDTNAMRHSTIVTPALYGTENSGGTEISNAEMAARRLIAASTAVAIGEHVRSEGGDALVILDDLKGHQDMWKYTCDILLDAAEGLNVFQGADDSAMRQFYSNLFQRVGRFNTKKGGGSLSMLMVLEKCSPKEPEDREYTMEDFQNEMINDATRARIAFLAEKGVKITKDVLRKLEIPAPGTRTVESLASIQDIDSLISLSDGHITLDSETFAKGRRPAVDPSNSLTRVGIGSGMVQGQSFAPVITKVAPRARLDIAQILKDRDEVLGEQRSHRIAVWDAVLTQEVSDTLELAKQSVFLFAVGRGNLDQIAKMGGTKSVREDLEKLFEYCQKEIPGLLRGINQTQDITNKELELLSQTVDRYFAAEMAPTVAAAM